MGIDRRHFLGLSGMAGLAVILPGSAARASEPIYLSAAAKGSTYVAKVFGADGEITGSLDLPARGHGGAFRPKSLDAVIFARRPGDFALVFERNTGRVKYHLRTPARRHFYGHGVFSPDGRLLYASENDYDHARGIISVWDASQGYRRVAEFDSYGTGPHDIRLLPGGRVLVIANGGIETHPDMGRRKLNIPEMMPSVVMIDVRSGAKISQQQLPKELHKLSIRHLGISKAGVVAAAMQYQGPDEDHPALVLTLQNDKLKLMSAPETIQRRMTNYCGSIVMDVTGELMAASSPRGNLVTIWNVAEGRYLRAIELADGSGLAASPAKHNFLFSSGTGQRLLVNGATGVVQALSKANVRWDNHIVAG